MGGTKMSIQNRSEYTLACSQSDYATISTPLKTDLCGETGFTLGVAFYPSYTRGSGILASQEGAFSFGYSQGALYFESKNLGQFKLDYAATQLLDGWNWVEVVYTGNELMMYMQGVCVLKEQTSGEIRIDNQNPWNLGMFDGYLKNVTFFNCVLPEETIRQYRYQVYQKKLFSPSPLLALDFSGYLPKNLGTEKGDVRLNGKCDIVNLLPALSPGISGYATFRTKAVICDTDSSEMTIILKIYLPPSQPDGVLFSNGETEEPDRLTIRLEQNRPCVDIDNITYRFLTDIPSQTWVDIAITLNNKEGKAKLLFYIDGSPSGDFTLENPYLCTHSTDILIGNQKGNSQAENGFTGYIDMVAVFDSALSHELLLAYVDTPPYLLDKNLQLLCIFSENSQSELKSKALLEYRDCTVKFCTNTVRLQELPKLTINLPQVENLFSESDNYRLLAIADLISHSVEEITGSPLSGYTDGNGRLNGTVAQVLYQQFSNTQIYTALPDIDERDAADYLNAVVKGGILGILIYGFGTFISASMATTAISTFTLIGGAFSIPGFIFAALAGAIIGVAIVRLVKELRKKQKEDPPPIPPIPPKVPNVQVSIVSLSFYNESSKNAGALYALDDFGKEPVLPEWTSSKRDSSKVLYSRNAASNSTPIVILEFHCNLMEIQSAVIGFYATVIDEENNILGSLSEQSISVTQSGNYRLNFPLDKNKLKDSAIKMHTMKWSWTFTLNGWRFHNTTTTHNVHVIPSSPVLPWSYEVQKGLVPVYPAIEICEQIAELASSNKDEDKRFADQFVEWVWKQDKLTTFIDQRSSPYARWEPKNDRILLDPEMLITAAQNGARVCPLDLIALLLLLARLYGLTKIGALFLSASYGQHYLSLKKLTPVNGQPFNKRVFMHEHCVAAIWEKVEENQYKNLLCWDSFFKAADSNKKFKGIAFCDHSDNTEYIFPGENGYRQQLCQDYSSCRPITYMSILVPSKISPAKDTILVDPAKFSKGIYMTHITGRPDFDKSVIADLVIDPTPQRCHSISYNTIETTIINLFNKFYEGNLSISDFKDSLILLWCAVTVEKLENFNSTTDRFKKAAADHINLIILNINIGNLLNNNIEFYQEQARGLVYCLNNCLSNLSLGKSDWNASIGGLFDPSDWFWVYSRAIFTAPFKFYEESYILTCSREPEIELDLNKKVNLAGGFYLTDSNDNYRVSCMNKIQQIAPDCCNFSVKAGRIMDFDMRLPTQLLFGYEPRQILYSSKNQWNLSKYKIEAYSDSITVYFQDYFDNNTLKTFSGSIALPPIFDIESETAIEL